MVTLFLFSEAAPRFLAVLAVSATAKNSAILVFD